MEYQYLLIYHLLNIITLSWFLKTLQTISNQVRQFETSDKSIDIKNKIKATSTSTNNTTTRIKKRYACREMATQRPE